MNQTPIQRLLAWAKSDGLNQTGLAHKLGVLPQDITNWKRRGLPSDKFHDAAQAFNRTVDELLGREIGATPPPWPFKYISANEWAMLDDHARGMIEQQARSIIAEFKPNQK